MWWWLACAPAPVPWCREDPAYDSVMAQLDLAVSRGSVPGASVAIVEAGALVCSEAVGSRRYSADEAVTRDTRFGFGSVTKMLTAAAVVQAGVDLDAPITDLVPDLTLVPTGDPRRDDPSAITMGQLLSHTAGYRDEFGIIGDGCPYPDVAAFVAAPRQLVTPPGLAWHYANPGYAVVDVALRAATGRDHAETMDELVFGPFGLQRATLDLDELSEDGDHAFGYFDPTTTDAAAGEADPTAWDCPGWVAAAGAYGTAEDLGHFVEAMLDPRGPLDDERRAALLGPRAPTGSGGGYGLGVQSEPWGDRTIYGHTGRYAGFLTSVAIEPVSETAVIALFASDELYPEPFATDAVATLAGLPGPAEPASEPDTTHWDDFTGEWRHDGDWTDPAATDPHEVLVRRDRDHLFFSRDDGAEEEMQWWWGDAFYVASEDDVFVFVREDGAAAWMVGRGWSARRP